MQKAEIDYSNTLFYKILFLVVKGDLEMARKLLEDKHVYFKGTSGILMENFLLAVIHENSGDYANSWLFGDTNTNEILRIELGLKYHNVERTKNGYLMVSFSSSVSANLWACEKSISSNFSNKISSLISSFALSES